MKLLAINGSPRKNWNTAQLLEQVIAGASAKGADAELVHLRELQFSGCISCFACKRIGGSSYGRCGVKDELEPILQKAHDADVLVFGAPIYFSTESALARAFLERLWFQYYLYSAVKPLLSPRKKGAALIYTMNVPEEKIEETGYTQIVERAKAIMEKLFAPCEVLLSCDTLQFNDYSKYDTDVFDVPAKQKRHAKVFPEELKKAYDLGVKLVE